MAYKIRQKSFRQAMKQPDEFVSATQKTLLYLQENIKAVSIVGIAVIAVILSVVMFFQRSKAQNEEHLSDLYAKISQANYSYNDGKYDEAAKYFQEIIDIKDKPGMVGEIALVGLGYTYMDSNKDESIKLFEELIAREDFEYPKEELMKNLAILYESTGKKDLAIEKYKRIVELFPESTEVAYYKSKIAAFSGMKK